MQHGLPIRIQLDLTNKCNASCPQCERVDAETGKDRSYIAGHAEWDLAAFECAFPADSPIRDFELCGNYGDPIAARDCAAIVEYLDRLEKRVWMHTNGSIQTAQWWKALGRLRAIQDVCFAIDGVDQQTHEYYRRFTRLDKVLENARAFIAAGGRARWQFIAFEHNEHQIDEARRLSKELGFQAFTLIESTRPNGVYRDQTGRVFPLRQVRTPHTLGADRRKSEVERLMSRRHELEPISCKYRLYVDAQGFVYPCCHMAAFYGKWLGGDAQIDRGSDIHANVLPYPLGDDLNAKRRPLADVLRHEWFDDLRRSLAGDPMHVCIKKCHVEGYRSQRSTVALE